MNKEENYDSRIIAAMYNPGSSSHPITAGVKQPLLEQTKLESHNNVSIIKFNKQTLAVPTVGYVRSMEKEIDSLKRQLATITSGNRQLQQSVTKMMGLINKLSRELDGKIDKL